LIPFFYKLDKIPVISIEDKIIIVLDKKIENITEIFDHVQLVIQDNQIVMLGPKIAQTLTDKLPPAKMEAASTVS